MRRLVVIGVVLLSACSASQSEPTIGSSAPPSSSSSSRPEGAGEESHDASRAEVEAALIAIGPVRSLDQARAVVEEVAAGSDPDLIPYLYDIARVSDADLFIEAMAAIARITGVSAPEDDFRSQSLFFGNWIMDNAPDPGPAYIAWKATVFGNIDPAFEPLIALVEDAVTASRLQWGGVRRGGIPELNDAETISVAAADYMIDDEIVFGAVVDGRARAYPVRILGHHELANDTLGGKPVALVYCTLCRTPVFYNREVTGQVLDFQTSGLLINSNKVMVDVQTNSLWNQLTGEAFSGPLAGEVLERLPMTVTTWADWIATHPDTDVQKVPTLDLDAGTGLNPLGGYSYEPGDAYADYYASNELWFPSFAVPEYFEQKDEVVTLDLAGSRLAVGLDALLDAGGLVTTVADRPVVFVASENGGRVYQSADGLAIGDGRIDFNGAEVTIAEDALTLPDGTKLYRLVSGQSFWFAWYGNFPDTDWWPKG
jgi:hypothetical protein